MYRIIWEIITALSWFVLTVLTLCTMVFIGWLLISAYLML